MNVHLGLPHLHIKFHDQIHLTLTVTKKTNLGCIWTLMIVRKFVFFVTASVRWIWSWKFICRWGRPRCTFMIFFQNFLKTFLVWLHGDLISSVIAPDMSPSYKYLITPERGCLSPSQETRYSIKERFLSCWSPPTPPPVLASPEREACSRRGAFLSSPFDSSIR